MGHSGIYLQLVIVKFWVPVRAVVSNHWSQWRWFHLKPDLTLTQNGCLPKEGKRTSQIHPSCNSAEAIRITPEMNLAQVPSVLDGVVLGVAGSSHRSCCHSYVSIFSVLTQSELAWICLSPLEITCPTQSVDMWPWFLQQTNLWTHQWKFNCAPRTSGLFIWVDFHSASDSP